MRNLLNQSQKTTSLKKLCGQFGKLLERSRVTAGVSLSVVATHLGLDIRTYLQIERGNVDRCLDLIPLDSSIYEPHLPLNKTCYKLFSRHPIGGLIAAEVMWKAWQIYRKERLKW